VNRFYKIGFFILLLLLIGGGAYFLGKEKALNLKPTPTKTKIKITPSPTSSTKTTIAPTTASPKKSRAKVKENLEAAINVKDYAAIESYMADAVNVIIQSSECCGPRTKKQAIDELTYIKDAHAPWNFDDANPTAAALRANSPNYGDASSIIGIASNEYVIAFILNSENEVKGMTMAVTYKLVVP
jgi:hypothetical protein